MSKGGKQGDRKGKRRIGKGNQKGKGEGKNVPKDPDAKREFLDRDLDQYWVKGGHHEVGK